MLAGYQQGGKGNAGGPAFDTAGHRHGGERLYARQSPARHRQARFAKRHYAKPQEGQGPEEILERESTLTTRLKEAARVERREGSTEKQEWQEG